MPICGSVWQGAELARGFFKVFGETRAKIRDGAAGKKESNGQSLAMELTQGHRLAQFIGESVIHQWMVRSWSFGQGQGWGGRRLFFADSRNVVDPALRLVDV